MNPGMILHITHQLNDTNPTRPPSRTTHPHDIPRPFPSFAACLQTRQTSDDRIAAMQRKIISVEYEIPGFHQDCCSYATDQSLLDADVIVFQTRNFGSAYGKASFGDAESFSVLRRTEHWRRELHTALNYGKTVFLILAKHEVASFQTGRQEVKGRTMINYVEDRSNYEFLPAELPSMTGKSGTSIVFTGDSTFAILWNEFKTLLRYECYLNEKVERPIFVTKTGERPVGAVFRVGKGHLVVLPFVDFDLREFFKTRKDGRAYWKADAIQFGSKLVKILLDVDKSLRSEGAETPMPAWAEEREFVSSEEARIRKEINDAAKEIDTLRLRKSSLEAELKGTQALKNLLFGTGKPLEGAVIKSLRALGYSAENYDDGDLELDQVIVSPEGERLIGECEGKDNAAVNIDKFRQLAENIQADLQREEVSKPAVGILFGNGFRLTAPKDRQEQFTTKCLASAKRETILVRTTDLYPVVQYLRETNDRVYAKACREAIRAAVGGIVNFPAPPKS